MLFGMNGAEMGVILFVMAIRVLPPLLVCIAAVFAIRWFVRQDRVSKAPEAVKRRASLAEVLRAHREACGMTQELVAAKLGVSRQAVSKWERGDSEPSTTNLMAVAELFGTDAASLLGEIESRPRSS